ncbi:alpha/beta fold hydrolase [Marinobacter sp.]|uniref:alpha/beta fold hydrolase n=1 Tax=Marinobacter sp. TaxID=50741 RepID=UPI001B4DA44F|nr:alpha/beta fold hydrolase [Marinobacter sp.]MBQ0832205.1 alpha/beta fold hydrolase [Marinobacter sp.]
MSFSPRVGRLVVVGGWGVPVEMLAELYEFWPGPVELVSLDDGLLARCDSVSEVADALLSRYPEPSVWMGWSLGAQVVMAAACRNAGAVSAVITLAGFPRFLAGEHWPHGMSVDQFEAFSRDVDRQREGYWQRFLLLMIKGSAGARADRRWLKGWLSKGSQVSQENLVKSLKWLGYTDQRALWARVSRPVLHITGGCDQVTPGWSDGIEATPKTREVVVPGMAHYPGGAFAADCRKAIETFLQPLAKGAW